MKSENSGTILGQLARSSFDVFLALYFIHHILSGKYGLLAYRNVDTQLLSGENLTKKMENDVKRKRNRVERLKKSNLDLDLFEEEMKKNFGMIGYNEVIVIVND
ncbi:MAG: septum formation initiator family protein [Rickettsiales bacterium]|jgi:cell division protein FtsB|nr:septum formation initiator family protein [Rickettsiales bacterium]